MWKRSRTCLLLAALTGVLLAVYFEPSRCVRGWLWGEAFFDGRPTSYWHEVVERDLQMNPGEFFRAPNADEPGPGVWQRIKNWIPYQARVDSSSQLADDEGADAVLHELTSVKDEAVAGFARDVLKNCRPIRFGGAGDPQHATWYYLIAKYNTKHPGWEVHFTP